MWHEWHVCSGDAALMVSESWPGIHSTADDGFNCGNMFALIQSFRVTIESCHWRPKIYLPLENILMMMKSY